MLICMGCGEFTSDPNGFCTEDCYNTYECEMEAIYNEINTPPMDMDQEPFPDSLSDPNEIPW
jgi:hypothetical protein